ncbi:hypothetical protein PFISCL1PPCAC_14351, partial [Pristionchus fissidentatus]
LKYGMHLDRDYFLDIVYKIQSIVPIVCSLTVYPANAYLLLIDGPSMMGEIRAAYLINLVTHVFFDWVFSFFIRFYAFPPYGLFYCEGILCGEGAKKQLIMGLLATAIMAVIPTFYVLMVRMHQMVVVVDIESRWKLSLKTQIVIYASLFIVAIANVIGFVLFTSDVENFEELVMGPDLAWMKARGGSLVLFGEPGKRSLFVNG